MVLNYETDKDSGEPMVSVRDPWDGESLGVPNIFVRKPLGGKELSFPPIAFPINDFTNVRVDFPQEFQGNGMENAIQITITMENIWTGRTRVFNAWLRSDHTEEKGFEVAASLVWTFDDSDRLAQCSLLCDDKSCGTRGLISETRQAANSLSVATAILQTQLAEGKTHGEALAFLYTKFVEVAKAVMGDAEKSVIKEYMASKIGYGFTDSGPVGMSEKHPHN